jgi:hypothetical protein
MPHALILRRINPAIARYNYALKRVSKTTGILGLTGHVSREYGFSELYDIMNRYHHVKK